MPEQAQAAGARAGAALEAAASPARSPAAGSSVAHLPPGSGLGGAEKKPPFQARPSLSEKEPPLQQEHDDNGNAGVIPRGVGLTDVWLQQQAVEDGEESATIKPCAAKLGDGSFVCGGTGDLDDFADGVRVKIRGEGVVLGRWEQEIKAPRAVGRLPASGIRPIWKDGMKNHKLFRISKLHENGKRVKTGGIASGGGAAASSAAASSSAASSRVLLDPVGRFEDVERGLGVGPLLSGKNRKADRLLPAESEDEEEAARVQPREEEGDWPAWLFLDIPTYIKFLKEVLQKSLGDDGALVRTMMQSVLELSGTIGVSRVPVTRLVANRCGKLADASMLGARGTSTVADGEDQRHFSFNDMNSLMLRAGCNLGCLEQKGLGGKTKGEEVEFKYALMVNEGVLDEGDEEVGAMMRAPIVGVRVVVVPGTTTSTRTPTIIWRLELYNAAAAFDEAVEKIRFPNNKLVAAVRVRKNLGGSQLPKDVVREELQSAYWQHAADRSYYIPNNDADEAAPQPPYWNAAFPLRIEQLRSLRWMQNQVRKRFSCNKSS